MTFNYPLYISLTHSLTCVCVCVQVCVCGVHFCMVCQQQINAGRPYEHFRPRRGGCNLFPAAPPPAGQR